MKIFGWMQSKFNGKQGTKKPNSTPANNHTLNEPCKEEFSDWPHGLLAIGTFGNNSLKEDPERCNFQGSQSSSQDHLQDITPEEVLELQKELTLLLHKQVSAESSSKEELETHNLLQLNNFSFTSNSDDDRSNIDTVSRYSEDKSGQLQRSASVILNKEKDARPDHTKNAFGKKSLYYLLKKKFLCRSGLAPTPSLRDPMPDKSRMEKILRVILHKKIYPHNSSAKATTKKYLETNNNQNTDSDDEMPDTANDGSKWVKTDSEFIVLEI
ncbi:protein DEEPER ROOTING 1 [Actinidia eriantha]|uniref:protein DEEPER ROOTING 1 n=1 Tax=Actinidia eriantha TaxID=165200 RepID=UPI002584E042|nr:protein DEEPER ROOTING 1 [Actinidia eriantha]